MQVRFVGSKISTPWQISAMIDSVDAWKALSSSGVQSNRQLGLRNGFRCFVGAGRKFTLPCS